MELKSLVYVSSARRPYPDDALMALLAKSRRNNAAAGVTGLLLYDEGNFIQALEGPPDAVGATFARIERDPAHHQLIRMFEGTAPERQFGEWSMGFADIARFRDRDIPGLSDFLDAKAKRTAPSSEIVWIILTSFRRQLRSYAPGVR
ncbi:MAG: BLUF domain-containing protein [Rhodospirillaceae bacterium]|nr:BLUF domain-containing protein [Rhodospirillaceae bacterium]